MTKEQKEKAGITFVRGVFLLSWKNGITLKGQRLSTEVTLSNMTGTVWSWNSSLVRKSFGQRISLGVCVALVLFVFNYNIFVIYALLFVTVIKIISQFILPWN